MRTESAGRYRFTIALILILGMIGLNVLWFIPSPLLTIIMEDLHLNLTQGGLGMSIVCLLIAVFSLLGGLLVNLIGIKRSFLYGLFLMAAGAGYTYFVADYTDLFLSRVLIGIGFGLCLPVIGVAIMIWFPENEHPYMNAVNSAIPYLATIITFSLTLPLFRMMGNSWRMTVVVWGIILAGIAVVWSVCGREHPSGISQADGIKDYNTSLYRQVWKNREVRLITLAVACDLFSFQFITSMLPTYLTMEAGLSIDTASNLTAIFPVTGLIAGLVCGVWMARAGLRKPFTYPMHLMIFAGTAMAVFGTHWIRILGIAMAGFGNAGWAPALLTMPMEFEEMTAEKVGIVYGIMWSMAYLAAFISPWWGGFIAELISLRYTITLISVSSLIAAYATFKMKETGPGKSKQEKSVA